jgi:hypothetical protein
MLISYVLIQINACIGCCYFQILDEMLDNGFPLAVESNILKELIKPPNFLRTIADTITGKTTGYTLIFMPPQSWMHTELSVHIYLCLDLCTFSKILWHKFLIYCQVYLVYFSTCTYDQAGCVNDHKARIFSCSCLYHSFSHVPR